MTDWCERPAGFSLWKDAQKNRSGVEYGSQDVMLVLMVIAYWLRRASEDTGRCSIDPPPPRHAHS